MLLTACAAVLSAAEFRLDIDGGANGRIAPVSCSEGVVLSQASWLGVNKDRRMTCNVEITSDWKEYSFTFIPKADGRYGIHLMSEKKNIKVCCDDIVMTGAKIANGSFEKMNDKGLPVSWYKSGKASISSDNAADGNNCAVSTHDDRWTQNFVCKKGEPVTVTFKARKY